MKDNALQQYLDLYDAHRDSIGIGTPGKINEIRQLARQKLDGARLPRHGSEDYELSDLEKALAPDYGLNLSRMAIPVDPAASFKCRVPNMSTALFFLLNDSFATTPRSQANLPEGVIVCSLRKAAAEYPEILQKYYGSVASLDNETVALNSLLVQDGVLIYIPKGVKAAKTIQLVNILQSDMSLLSARRLLIVAEEDSEAKILMCDHTQNEAISYLSLQTIEIVCKRNSRLDLYDLEESSQLTTRLSSLYARMEGGSNLLLDGITLYNGTTRNEYYVDMHDRDAELHLLGMGIEDAERRLDTYSLIRHNAPHCKSRELFKYVVDDDAKGAFSGRIYVAPHAVKTEAYQSNRNIVGTANARMLSKPQLEIYNDDVKCSHGSATGQLDQQRIFYMRSRGLTDELARKLLKQAFMADVIDGVRVPELRDRLRMLVDHRFSGATDACASCATTDCTQL